MNLIEYAIDLGEALSTTLEGIKLVELHNEVSQKYKENKHFDLYNQCVREDAARLHFFSWDASYQKFVHVNNNPEEKDLILFKKTADIVVNDSKVIHLCKQGIKLGESTVDIGQLVMKPEDVSSIKGVTINKEVKIALKDLQVAIQRSGMIFFISSKLSPKQSIIHQGENSYYAEEREKISALPFSDTAIKFRERFNNVDKDHAECIERLMLVRYIIYRGIYEGFWKLVQEIKEEDIIEYTNIGEGVITKVSFKHNKSISGIIHPESWLYRIKQQRNSYVLASHRSISWNKDGITSEVSGLSYPEEDIGLLKKEKIVN